MGEPQPPTPIHIDNSTCVGIVINIQKHSKSRGMHGKYFLLLDRDSQNEFSFHQHPGQENLGNYPSKAHMGTIYKHVRPHYVHMENSPRTLARAMQSSSRRGCAETLDDPYYHRVALPRIPGYHKLDKQARLADVHDRHASTTYAYAASNTSHARFTSLLRSISKTGPSNYYARLQALHNPNR